MAHGQDELLKQHAARLERRVALLADRVALLEQANDALASRLQSEGAEAFVKSWKSLIATIASERSTIG